MKPVICIEMIYPERELNKKIEAVARERFSWIEFWDWKDKNLDLLLSSCQKFKIQVANFSGHRLGSLIAGDTHPKIFSDVKEAVKAAAKLHCPYLMLLTDQLGEGGIVENSHPELSMEEKYHNIISSLDTIIDLTPDSITLVLETLNTRIDHPGYYLNNIDTAVQIIRAINHPRLKILADLYHLGVMELNLNEIIKNDLPEIGYFHIADLPGRHEPGTGQVDWLSILQLIKESGYQGFVGFEYSPEQDSTDSLRKIKALWQSIVPDSLR